MKNLFELSQDEKNRIISLHETATKRLYLVEQQVIQGGTNDPYQYKKTGDKVEYALKGTEDWKAQTNPKGVEAINKLFLKSAPATTPAATPPAPQTNVNNNGDADNEPNPNATTNTQNTTTGAGTGAGEGTGEGTGEGNKPSTDVSLTDKITKNCGEIWNSYLERLKKYQEQMKGKDLKSQKDIAKKMSKDEKKTFNYCHKLYKPKLLPTEKTNYAKVGSNFKKLLSAVYKFLAPSVVKMMQTTIEKAADAGTENVLRSLKLSGGNTKPGTVTPESRYKETDLDRIIKESIKKNTSHL